MGWVWARVWRINSGWLLLISPVYVVRIHSLFSYTNIHSLLANIITKSKGLKEILRVHVQLYIH